MKPRWLWAAIIGLALAAIFFIPSLPQWVPWLHAGMSVVAFVAYVWDKSRAKQGGWRTKESLLQLVALLGGWPGALMGQIVLRHKTRKVSFQIVFWNIVVLHILAWSYWIARP